MAVEQTTWASRAFIAAGVLLLAAVAYSALGAFEPGLGRYQVSYPLVFIAVGGSGLAAAVGLLGLGVGTLILLVPYRRRLLR
jgi:hypothetical protein